MKVILWFPVRTQKFFIINWKNKLRISYCWISGGAILDTLDGREPRDIDIYFPSQREQEKAVSKAKVQGAKVIQQYPLGTKLEWDGIEIDLTFLGENPEEVFDKYDYTILCVAIDKNRKFFHQKLCSTFFYQY